MSKEAMKLALEALITASGHVNNEAFVKVMMARDALVEALAEQPAQQALDKMAENARELGLDYEPAQPKYRRGDRLICLETEEYCVIHISGTDRQWVKFPDTHIGVYKNEQLAELFELLPKEIEIEQPAQQEPVGCEGAIVNGRVYADRLEHDYKFECEAGPLHLCNDWVEFRRCFEWLAQHTPQPAQQQEPWVGLTDEEMREIYKRTDWDMAGGWEYERAIESKLKEKNT